MIQYLEIGSTPSGETCQQVGMPSFDPVKCRAELRSFQDQLTRTFPPPIGCRFAIKTFPHDFGLYNEVCAMYDDNDEKQVDWAFTVEAHTPEYWDEKALEMLNHVEEVQHD